MKKLNILLVNKLVMKQRHPFVEKYITQPLTNLLLFLANEPFALSKFTKLLFKNRVVFTGLCVLILLLGLSYSAGKKNSFSVIEYLSFKLNGSYSKIEALNSDIYNKTNTIEDLSAFLSSREYMKYRVYNESKILIPEWFPTEHLELMLDEADRYEVPYKILFRVTWKETRFKSAAISSAGAKGYMQIMPLTFSANAKKLKLKGGHTLENNIKVGVYLLHSLFDKWNDKYSEDKAWELALSEYNSGIVNVLEANENIPNIKETKSYVSFITKK